MPFDPDKYLGKVKEGKSKLESGLRGAAQGASLGFADEITGGLESLVTDKPYQQARDESRAEYVKASEDNPMTYGAGEIAGGVGSTLATGGGLGTAAALGAASGAGYADELQDVPANVAMGASVGAAGAMVGKAASGLKNKLGQFAEGRAAAALDTDPIIGRDLLKSGAVNPLNTQKETLQKLTIASKPYAEEKAVMLRGDPSQYSLDDIANKVRNKLGVPVSDAESTSLTKVFDEVESAAERANFEPVDAQRVDRLRKKLGIESKFNKERFGAPGDEMASKGFRDAYGVIKGELESRNPGLSNLNRKLSSFENAADNVNDRRLGLKDLISKQNVASKVLDKSNQFMAVTADTVAKVLPQNPQAFGKYANVLDNALRKSPESLRATLHVLQMSDPEFRQLINSSDKK